MDKIVLKTFTSNSRKLSWQKFHDYLTCEFTDHYLCNLKRYTCIDLPGLYSKSVIHSVFPIIVKTL